MGRAMKEQKGGPGSASKIKNSLTSPGTGTDSIKNSIGCRPVPAPKKKVKNALT